MAKPTKSHSFKVDEFLSHLTVEDRMVVDDHCLKRPTRTSVKALLDDLRREYAERGVSLPYMDQRSVDRWFDAVYNQATEDALKIRAIAATLGGLTGDEMVTFSAAIGARFLENATPLLTNPDYIRDCKNETVIHNAIAALKELRTIGLNLTAAEHKATPRALERSGAYRLAEITRQLAKDQRFETEVNELLNAALIQHDSELR